MAICTRHSFLHIYKPLLLFALEDYFKDPSIDVLAKLFTSVNSMDLSTMPRLSIFERQILAASDNKDMFSEKFEMAATSVQHVRSQSSLAALVGMPEGEKRITTYIDLAPGRNKLMNGKITISRDSHEFETKVVYNGIQVPIRVPVAILPETVGDVGYILNHLIVFVVQFNWHQSVLTHSTYNNVLGATCTKPATIFSSPAPHNKWSIYTSRDSFGQRPSYREKNCISQSW